MSELEEWRPCPFGQSLYEVSSLGRVRSWNNNRWGRRTTPLILRAHTDKDGYQVVNLAGGMVKRVHALVCRAFHGDPPPELQCCHGDDDPANNRADNLRWDTPVGNMSDQRRSGAIRLGAEKAGAKLTEEQVVAMRELRASGKTLREIGSTFGVALTTVGPIVRGEKWKHVGGPLNG